MKFVGITSCPAGIAHTYMAAEKLESAAKELGYEIKVETQGSVGAENVITGEDLKGVTAVIVAADCKVDLSRFANLPILEVPSSEAIKNPKTLFEKAMALKPKAAVGKSAVDAVLDSKAQASVNRTGIYKHLMTGVSYLIPFVVTGGILIALAFLLGGIYVKEGTFAFAIKTIGGAAFSYLIPILAGYMAYSIADRPGLVPGMVGGFIASSIGAGFLGGIVAGLAAGYIALLMKKYIKLPKALEGLKPIVIIPLFSSVIVGLLLIYVLGNPVAAINTGLSNWLTSMSQGSAIVLGLIAGLMMAFDMGGPVNKAMYMFAVGTLTAGEPSAIMAAVMAAGMVPPLGLAVATLIDKKLFTLEEREAGKVGFVLGAAFITEGAIPFAAADPLRVIPSIMAGSALTGALSMAFGCKLSVPHGGIFVLPIPNAMQGLLLYIVALLAGIALSAVLVIMLKKMKVNKANRA